MIIKYLLCLEIYQNQFEYQTIKFNIVVYNIFLIFIDFEKVFQVHLLINIISIILFMQLLLKLFSIDCDIIFLCLDFFLNFQFAVF